MKKDDIWKYIVYTIGIFIISGISFKIGEIVTSAKEITCKEALESFYYSSWAVYTTIFGLFGIILGVVFPLYQSNRQEKEYKEDKKGFDKVVEELDEIKVWYVRMKPIIVQYENNRVESMIGIGFSLFDSYQSEGKTETEIKEKIKYFLEDKYGATEKESTAVIREIKRRWEQEKKDRAE